MHFILIVIVAFLFSIQAMAQTLTVTEIVPLNFGTILADGNRGSVTLNESNGSISSSRHTLLGGHSVGEVVIVSSTRDRINISVSADNNLVGMGGSFLAFDSITSNAKNRINVNANVATTILIGGKITLDRTQQSGTYTGNYYVTVNY